MIVTNFPTKGTDWCKIFDNNFKALQKQDKKAKENNTLVGRFISEQYADGYAHYVVIKENKRSCRIKAATGIGDDWVIPYWGEETTVDRDYVEQKIAYAEHLSKLFG